MTTSPAPQPKFWGFRLVWTREFTIWFGVAVLIGVVGWVKAINLLMLFSYLMVGLVLVNGFLAWRMVRKVSVARTPPPPLFAGEPALVVGSVTNASGRPVVVTIQETSGPARRSWFLPSIPATTTVPFTGPIEFPTRGRYSLPSLEVVSGFPFGLVHVSRPLSTSAEVTVLPALGFVDLLEFRRWLVVASALFDSSRRVMRRTVPSDGEVRGVRPYRHGDSPRDVHWKTSARRDQLLVRDYDRSPPMDLAIVVDPWVPSIPTDRISLAKLELALSLALSVGWAWVHGDLPGDLTLLVGGKTWVARAGAGTPAFVRSGFDCLADVTGCPDMAPLPPKLFRTSLRSSRLLISTRVGGPVLAELRSTGLSVAVVDPSIQPHWFLPRKERVSG
jgi:uncharacterized protein (DUF58 family)